MSVQAVMRSSELDNLTHAQLVERRKAYQLALQQPAVQMLLQDLAKYCHARSSPVPETDAPIDTNRAMVRLGRQQVWFRIANTLHLTPDELFKLYTGRFFNPKEIENEPDFARRPSR